MPQALEMKTQSLSHLPQRSQVVVAMSGGVDSSVAAAWLKQQGHNVIGISLQLHDQAQNEENKFGTCCSISDIQDARRVAEKIGIPFYVANMEDQFEEAVIDNFVGEYLRGRTPNPCVKCNEKVKFSRLMDWAMDMGADYLATGHYARIVQEDGSFSLKVGLDPQKDQSYFLFTMRPHDLPRTVFPVGDLAKDQVRQLALELGLNHVASKPDSQEICFVQKRTYREFIEERVPPSDLKPGNLVDTQGRVLGAHSGVHHFTIGQRKGLGVNSLEPLYVLEIRPDTAEVVVGPERGLLRKRATVAGMHWIHPDRVQPDAALHAKIRYRAAASPVTLSETRGSRVDVFFEHPQRAITPGQALVLYQGDTVVGGGWIESLSLDI